MNFSPGLETTPVLSGTEHKEIDAGSYSQVYGNKVAPCRVDFSGYFDVGILERSDHTQLKHNFDTG